MTPDKQRFYNKISISESGCWLWKAGTTGGKMPYGKFWLNGTYMKAHRASYILHIGGIPDGACVCHKCDTPLCVNPEHLFIGSKRDNAIDMVTKGRGGQSKNPPRGDRRVDSKLTQEKVLDIRKRCSEGQSQSSVGKLYGIAQSAVCKIVNRIRWSHV